MSERKEQPKIFQYKFKKKGQRSPPPGVTQLLDPAAASYLKGNGSRGLRSVSTSSSTSAAPSAPKQPVWYKSPRVLGTLLAVNAVVVGYALFRTSTNSPEIYKEAVKEAAAEKLPSEAQKDENQKLESMKIKSKPSDVAHASNLKDTPSAQKPTRQDQQELFKWMLAEKRKHKPASKAEKAQMDSEKALLKDFLRGGSVLNL